MADVDAVVPMDGAFDDGEPDQFEWRARVEGIDAEDADEVLLKVELLSQFTVEARLGAGTVRPPETMIEPVPVSSGEQVDEDVWELSGVIESEDVFNGFEGQFITAWVNLPDHA